MFKRWRKCCDFLCILFGGGGLGIVDEGLKRVTDKGGGQEADGDFSILLQILSCFYHPLLGSSYGYISHMLM